MQVSEHLQGRSTKPLQPQQRTLVDEYRDWAPQPGAPAAQFMPLAYKMQQFADQRQDELQAAHEEYQQLRAEQPNAVRPPQARRLRPFTLLPIKQGFTAGYIKVKPCHLSKCLLAGLPQLAQHGSMLQPCPPCSCAPSSLTAQHAAWPQLCPQVLACWLACLSSAWQHVAAVSTVLVRTVQPHSSACGMASAMSTSA